MRRSLRLAAAASFLLAAGLFRPALAAEPAPYEIDAVLSLTGAASFLGLTEQRALQILEPLVNAKGGIGGRPLHFVFYDDESSPQLAVQLVTPIVASHAAVMIGPAFTATCNAVMPLVKDGPVSYCLSPGIHPAAGGYMLTVPIATRDGQEALVRYFKARGLTRIGFIASTDATGREAEGDLDVVLSRPENSTMTMVAREHFNPTDVSAIAQMERIKAASPQVVFAWSTGAAVATLFKGIVQAGLDVPVVTTNGNMTYQQMNQYADFLPRQLYLPSSVWIAGSQGMKIDPAVDAAQRVYFQALKAADVAVDSAATNCWDPAMILVDALRKLGPDATAAQVHDFIMTLKDYGGVQGLYDFTKTPQRGVDVHYAVVTRWMPAEHTWKVMSKPTGIPLD